MSTSLTDGAFAYPPDRTLRELIGSDVDLNSIFTKERIERSQKIMDDAKASFFDKGKADMLTISDIASKERITGDARSVCNQLHQPVNNIKSQAEVFGFPLIVRVCKYLLRYADKNLEKGKPISKKDEIIILKLIEALEHAFHHRIMDTGGAIEKELVAIIEMAST